MEVERQVTYKIGNVAYINCTKKRTAAGTNRIIQRIEVDTPEKVYAIPGDIATPREITIQYHGAAILDVGFATGVYPIRITDDIPNTFNIAAGQGSMYLLGVGGAGDVTIVITED